MKHFETESTRVTIRRTRPVVGDERIFAKLIKCKLMNVNLVWDTLKDLKI